MSVSTFLNFYRTPILFGMVSVIFYGAFAYDLERYDFIKLIGLYVALGFLAYKIIQLGKTNFSLLIGLTIIFRLVFLIATPNLSQDFYRFLWDGRLLVAGFNPYLYTPDVLLVDGTAPLMNGRALYEGMGSLSAGHFTNYPPINQVFFAIAGYLSPSSILGGILSLRTLIIAADLGTLYFGRKLLKVLHLPEYRMFWYLLNPFIIIELTGNLHFEGVMLFFVVASLYFLHQKKWWWAAVLLGTSVSIKLLPLLFLPLFWQFLMLKKEGFTEDRSLLRLNLPPEKKLLWRPTLFYAVVLATVVLTFIPFFSQELIANFSATIGLWFQKFEFNASVYYLIREAYVAVRGFNMITDVGSVLPLLVIAGLLLITFGRKNDTLPRLLTGVLFGVCFYFLLSTTVHPWYAATPLLLCVFTRYRFPIVWAFTVFFSYAAYGKNGFDENLWLVLLEYSLVIGYAGYEIFWVKPKNRIVLSTAL